MNTTTDNQALDVLRRDGDAKLAPFDAQRARSLVSQFDRYALSTKQWALVHALARLATHGASSARATHDVGDLSNVLALFVRAGANLKSPTIVMSDGTGAEYRLKVARGRARHPGTLDVTTPDGATWFGRVLLSGLFEASPRVDTPSALPSALRAFAVEPAKFAGAHARATGRCMFCNLRIGEGDDPRARAVGYGEVCARNWGQPFPSKSDARALNAALFAAPSSAP